MVGAKVKRERLATSTHASNFKVSIDRISKLPDEVLGLIFSFLTMKEAVATSILSRSWKYSWMLTRKMDFDFHRHVIWARTQRERERNIGKLVGWVDRVLFRCILHQIQRSTLDEFRLFLPFNDSHGAWIDNWLTYALTRKVESLELNSHVINCDNPYEFPYKMGNFPANFKLLKKLCMHYVSVSGEAVKFFLRNCPLLEQVSVSGSAALKSLAIVGTFPSFKCLEISQCYNLQSVTIRDSNLVTIKYSGSATNTVESVFINVPLLTQLWIILLSETSLPIFSSPPKKFRLTQVVDMFSSLLPQLEMLKIFSLGPFSWEESREFIIADVEMRKLKQLVVNVGYCDPKDSLLPIINLLRVSPSLQKLVVQATHGNFKHDTWLSSGREVHKENPRTYGDFHLKEIEFVGYRGVKPELELIAYLMKNCVALENIIVDPRCFNLDIYRPWHCIPRHNNKDEILARAHAKKQLEEYVPSKVNVKIL